MPTYSVRDPTTGKTVRLTGDSPPTEQELEQIFAGLKEQPQSGLLERAGEVAWDAIGGLRSSAARTIYGGGDVIRRAVGMDRIIEQPESQVAMAAPESTAGAVGSVVGDVGQFFLPTGVVGKGKLLAEAAKSAGLTLAQTGSPTQAAVSAGITGAAPAVMRGAGTLAEAASGRLQRGAEKTVAQALGATKEGMKAEAAELAPQMLERGVRGSRNTMLEQARSTVSEVGQQIGAEVQRAAQAGATVSGLNIRGAIQIARDGLMVTDAAGKRVAIPETERVIQKLTKLDTFVESLGDDIPFDKAQKIKQTWDRVVSRAGLYTNRATASATDNAAAWSVREASSAFRELLASGSPALDDLNREFAFWKGLRNVLAETERRTQAQSGGLIAAGMGGSGAVIGGLSGDSMSDRVQNAVIGGVAGRQLVRGMQSPWWRTTASGPARQKLADALASGVPDRIQSAIGRIAASIPAQSSPVGATR
jgi:hypothetical protein